MFASQRGRRTAHVVSGGGGGGGAPALPTLTSTGQTPIFRVYSDAPTGHLYQDDALSVQANSGDTVLGIKDLSAAHNNFTDTVAGQGSVLTAVAINGKRCLTFNGSTSLLESDNSANINVMRTSSNVAIFSVFEIGGIGTQPYLFIASVKSRTEPTDCIVLKVGGSGGTSLTAGRWGVNSQNNFPLLVNAGAVDAGWSDFGFKVCKLVIRAATGVGAVQKLDLVISDGTTAHSVSTTYTNNGTDDVDATATPWDYCTIGGWYTGGTGYSGSGAYFAEAALWAGSSQMNDADVAALMAYGTGTAGF